MRLAVLLLVPQCRLRFAPAARTLDGIAPTGVIKRHDAAELALVFWTTIKGLALHKVALGPAYRSPTPAVLLGAFFEEE
jgi:hypothetical protein